MPSKRLLGSLTSRYMNSSSSTNLTAEPLLFNVNGASLRVFTQPEGITGRPRVVKLLKVSVSDPTVPHH